MKKFLLLPLLALGFAVASHAQDAMSFEALEYNYGTIKQGQVVNHDFKFKNAGKEPILITNAQGSCGCTVPEYPKEAIKPGGTGVIKVTFNSSGKSGMQDKTVTLTYNDNKTAVLHIKGNVDVPPAAANPAEGDKPKQ